MVGQTIDELISESKFNGKLFFHYTRYKMYSKWAENSEALIDKAVGYDKCGQYARDVGVYLVLNNSFECAVDWFKCACEKFYTASIFFQKLKSSSIDEQIEPLVKALHLSVITNSTNYSKEISSGLLHLLETQTKLMSGIKSDAKQYLRYYVYVKSALVSENIVKQNEGIEIFDSVNHPLIPIGPPYKSVQDVLHGIHDEDGDRFNNGMGELINHHHTSPPERVAQKIKQYEPNLEVHNIVSIECAFFFALSYDTDITYKNPPSIVLPEIIEKTRDT